MENLSIKFEEISGVYVRPQDFILSEGNLNVSPYGDAGISFDKDGNWWINDKSSTFIVLFIQQKYEVFDRFGDYLKEISFDSLQISNPVECTIEDSINEWNLLKEEMNITTSFLTNYHSGLIAANAVTIDTFFNAFCNLANIFLSGNQKEENSCSDPVESNTKPEDTKQVDEPVDLPF